MFLLTVDLRPDPVHKNSMKLSLSKLLPQISKNKALKIAACACIPDLRTLDCYARKPASVTLYNGPPDDAPCWWISIPSGDRVGGGRMIAVCKQTGNILYDGSDGME